MRSTSPERDTVHEALVYLGPGSKGLGKPPKARALGAYGRDRQIAKTTFAGPDLTSSRGMCLVSTWARPGSRGIGVVESVGTGRYCVQVGDRVLISCISTCGKCLLPQA